MNTPITNLTPKRVITFAEQDLRYMRSEPAPAAVLDLIDEDRKKGAKSWNRNEEPRVKRPRYSPLREHVSGVWSGPNAPEWLVSRVLDALMPPVRR